jgi:sialate O-acetylesterase
VEAWISRPALERLPAARPFLETYDLHHDLDRMDVGEFVADTVAEEQWGTMTLPGLIEDAGHEIDGVMWFRRTVDVPEAWEGRGLTLTLGAIDDNDVTFFAGSRIGATNNWRAPRTYAVPPELVRAGAAVVAVRVEDTGGAGGFSGTPEQLQLRPADGSGDALPLAGAWSMRVVADRPTGPTQHRPANLYNAMLHPLRQTAFRGAIWYQGESNAIRPRGEEYFTLFPAMIRDWRWTLGARDLPFYYVQLPGFTNDEPNTVWRYPVVRQAQLETLRLVPHTGMAVTLDLGEADDIHPRNKHDVGARLARLALVDTYGVTGLPASAPIFREAEFRGDGVVRVTLDRFGSTLAVRAGEAALAGFELAGSDGTFRPATARLEGDAVLVRSDEVPRPAAVRYAWRNNPTDANLVNAEGWPASPFRAGRAD